MSSLLLPASLAEATRVYPDVVISLARGKLRITSLCEIDDKKIYRLDDPSTSLSLMILEEDLILIRNVVSYFSPVVSSFHSEPFESVRDRARALIRVEFSGRGAF